MSTDDEFEAMIRARLADLADREDDWDDPLPEARRRSAEGGPEVTAAGDIGPVQATPTTRRRWLPGLAVAAVVLAVLVGGGFGLRELVGGGVTGSADGAAGSAYDAASRAEGPGCRAPSSSPCAPAAGGTEGTSASSGVSGHPDIGSGSGPAAPGGNDVAGCEDAGVATSTGPLAGVASVRPSGITGSRTTSGGTTAVPYQLTFAETRGSAELRAPRAVWVSDGRLCESTGTLQPGVIQVVPVAPGAGINGGATFAAVDSEGRSLPGGDYQVVIVIPYEIDGSALSYLVSAPVTVVVS